MNLKTIFKKKRRKKQIKIMAKMFTLGSVGYSILEILWRGFTHWTMALTGGFCLLSSYIFDCKSKTKNTIKKALGISLIITLTEFFVGVVVNKIFKLKIWDYSEMKFNFCGQICARYSFFWFVLAFPMQILIKLIKKKNRVK